MRDSQLPARNSSQHLGRVALAFGGTGLGDKAETSSDLIQPPPDLVRVMDITEVKADGMVGHKKLYRSRMNF